MTGADADVRLLWLINVGLRWKGTLTALTALGALAAGAHLWLTREYVAEESFVVNAGETDAARLSGLAAQFGFTSPIQESGESLAFYAELIRSGESLRRLGLSEIVAPEGGGSLSLNDYLGIEGVDSLETFREAEKELTRRITVVTDFAAGIVIVSARMPDREIAEAVASRVVDYVNGFNLDRRLSRAGEERRFVEDRLDEAKHELEDAEMRLQEFYADNRLIPVRTRIEVEAARLARRVDIAQQVYLTLAQAYEQARIAEVRDLPVITVFDPAFASSRVTARLSARIVLGAILGFMLACSIVLGGEMLQTQKQRFPDDYDEFKRLTGKE